MIIPELVSHEIDVLTPEAYSYLRCALIRFFEWNGCVDPQDLADEVFCRLLKTFASDSEIRNVKAFIFGIAQNVLREHRRQRQQERSLASEPNAHPSDSLVSETTEKDLDECLKYLSRKDRSLIRSYHDVEDRKKAAQRKVIAKKLKITENALRIRVTRIRKELQECIDKRRNQRQQDEMDSRLSSRKS
jgi:RNA polymerase sigma factor (sigma-70 family)